MSDPVHIQRHESNALQNEILGHLPRAEWALLEPHVTIITVKNAVVLFADNDPASHTYFPLTCTISMIAEMANGDECEYGCIGREGMLGLQVALGAQPLRGRAICQVEGEAVLFDGAVLRDLTDSGSAPELHRLLLRYAQATINVLAQSAACNALHTVTQRAARWLLLSRDRAASDTYILTQEFLAKMLGVRRASVTATARNLQMTGSIDYQRGRISILDGDLLVRSSCECYALMTTEYALVFERALG